MSRVLTLGGLVLLLAAGALYLVPILIRPASRPSETGLLLPPRTALPRSWPPIERALLRRDDPEALAALDLAARGEAESARARIALLTGTTGETGDRLAVLGLIELAEGKGADALKVFERALGKRPPSALARLGRARLRMAARRFEGARRDLEALTRTHPRHPEGWRLLALAALGCGDASGALEAAGRAAELAPGQREVRRMMGSCLLRLGREREASAWLKAAGDSLTPTR